MIDRRQVMRYFKFLFEDAPEGFIIVRAIGPGGETRTQIGDVAWYNDWPLLLSNMDAWDEGGMGIYVLPGPVRTHEFGNKAENLLGFNNVCVDVDDGDTRQVFRRAVDVMQRHPDLTVCSGGITMAGAPKIHMYWSFSEFQEDPERVAVARELLAKKIGADPSFKRSTQIIRIPGTNNWKTGSPVPCNIVEMKV